MRISLCRTSGVRESPVTSHFSPITLVAAISYRLLRSGHRLFAKRAPYRAAATLIEDFAK